MASALLIQHSVAAGEQHRKISSTMSVVEVLGGKRKQGRGPFWSAPFCLQRESLEQDAKFPGTLHGSSFAKMIMR